MNDWTKFSIFIKDVFKVLLENIVTQVPLFIQKLFKLIEALISCSGISGSNF